MPEGHTVHRTAKKLQRELGGRTLEISSPQGRFTDASLLNGQELKKAEAWGKQMFLHFPGGVLRIHLGIYGKWTMQSFEDSPPDARGAVRLRMVGGNFVADLRGPTACELIDTEAMKKVLERLGPDPLRNNSGDFEQFAANVLKSRRPVGQLLMDQSVLAGVGNVYRAEILFRNKQSPFTPGSQVLISALRGIWDDCVQLMPIGVRTGLMLTRDGNLKGRPKLSERYYVYKREGLPCRECGTNVAIELMAGRKLYWCPRCQD